MTDSLVFGSLKFDANLVYARDRGGRQLKFTRYERALLECFVANPGVLLTRDRLLDVIAGSNLEMLDRNVDYLMSRLRRKLGDSARNPQYIATQYGEGYLWIAPRGDAWATEERIVFLALGPSHGIGSLNSDDSTTAQHFLAALKEQLQRQFGPERRIEEVHSDADTPRPGDQADMSLEASFTAFGGSLTCSLLCLERRSGRAVSTHRLELARSSLDLNLEPAAELAARLRQAVWDAQIFRSNELPAMGSPPLSVSMHEANSLFTPGKPELGTAEQRVREKLKLDATDHRAAILLATSLRNQTFFGDLKDIPGRDREIEQLVLGHLQGIQDDPIYLSAAAEMLYELGYHDTARDIAERAIDLGTGIAACYMVLGRIQVLQGHFTEGLAYYEHSLEISEPDSLFYRMLKTRQCIACKAAGDQDRVRELTRYLTSLPLETGGARIHRILREQVLRIYFLGDDPEAFGRKNRLMASLVPRDAARRALLRNHYLTARHFRHEEHRRRVLAGALHVFVGRYGADIVPQVIRDSVPSLLAGSGAVSAA